MEANHVVISLEDYNRIINEIAKIKSDMIKAVSVENHWGDEDGKNQTISVKINKDTLIYDTIIAAAKETTGFDVAYDKLLLSEYTVPNANYINPVPINILADDDEKITEEDTKKIEEVL